MASTRSLTTTNYIACKTCGDAFDDTPAPSELDHAAISRIVVSYGTQINSLTVHYRKSSKAAIKHGGSGSSIQEVVLADDEFVTAIEGRVEGCNLEMLKFVTNRQTCGPYGHSGGANFNWNPSSDAGKDSRLGLIYFSGRVSAGIITGLQATFAPIPLPATPPPRLKFENTLIQPTEDAPILSKFCRNLLSPPVTLHVGATNTTFHVPHDLLCRLPFFRAALTGEFREAAEKAITMPEDNPEAVAALVEWLYNGSYTYTYVSEDSMDAPPPPDLKQGSFHVALYTVATKYDCQDLAEEAVRNFIGVLGALEGVECLRLWKEAYRNGLPLAEWKIQDNGDEFLNGMVKILKGLYTTNTDEVEEVFAEYPSFATDVLRLFITKFGEG